MTKKEEEDENPLAVIMGKRDIEESKPEDKKNAEEFENGAYVPMSLYKDAIRELVKVTNEKAAQDGAITGYHQSAEKNRDLTEQTISEKIQTDKVIWEDESHALTRIKQVGAIFLLLAGGFLFYQYQNSPVFHEQVGKFLANQFNVALIVILIIVCLYLILKYGRKKA